MDGGGFTIVKNSIFSDNYGFSEGGAIYTGSFNIKDRKQELYLENVDFTNNNAQFGHNNVYIWNSAAFINQSDQSDETSNSSQIYRFYLLSFVIHLCVMFCL